MRIGVLALQGAFAEHEEMLKRLDVPCFEIRKKEDLEESFDGLILPGGESTVQGKLLKDLGLFVPLKRKISAGLPVFGTCAGLLLLAGGILNDPARHFATMDICAVRNAFGRQSGSFHTVSSFSGIPDIPMTFIRGPYIETVYGRARALAVVDGKIVAARQDNQLVTAFHPELGSDLTVHRFFLESIVLKTSHSPLRSDQHKLQHRTP